MGRYASAVWRRIGRALYDNPIVVSSEWALKRRLRWSGASRCPRRPEKSWIDTVLKSDSQVDAVLSEVRRCGLPPHPDPPKNWDALGGLATILARTTPQARVLDAGAPLYSVILPWLYLYGYRELIGIDLTFEEPVRRGPISYEPGDLTATRFGDATFDAVACLSVIEHGVDPVKYFAEMSRILKPGGVLVTSADYWADGVDTGGQVAYGVPIRVFTRADIEDALRAAAEVGLRADGEIDLDCDEPVVQWRPYGLRFTFCCFVLTKT